MVEAERHDETARIEETDEDRSRGPAVCVVRRVPARTTILTRLKKAGDPYG